jgi:hypothetical protein
LDLYEASRRAFDSSLSAEEGLRYFQNIYDTLKSSAWQVFRSSRAGASYWTAQQVFETIKREFQEYSWGGPVNLLNFQNGGNRLRLESSFAKMQGIKQMRSYPHMAVSKFLHFYNPSLFPIYDYKVIWEKVFSRFRYDFDDFCRSESIGYSYADAYNDSTAVFLLYYMRWASFLVSAAHETFMPVFVEWLEEQPGVELRQQRFDAATLYATAFEFTVIGAESHCRKNRAASNSFPSWSPLLSPQPR